MEPHAIAHFEIVGRLAAGGMGVVYRARDRVLQRDVALKLIKPERAGDDEARQRFLREARAAAVLNHPGIAAVYEAGEATADGSGDQPQLYLVEELVEGETLAARVRRGPVPVAEVVRLGVQLAEALAAAHAQGIVHRDIKPSNLMVGPGGQLKILDFGIARRGGLSVESPTTLPVGEAPAMTAPGVFVGTPAYMAPEQMAGGAVGPPADVYGAGCVLYELLTGTSPFAGANAAELLHRALTETPRPLSEVRPGVPRALRTVVARALARDPAMRYASGHELAAALQNAETGRHSVVQWIVGGRPRWVRRLAAAVPAIAVVAAATWFVTTRLTRPAMAFNERDFVVVADVVNGTGEPVFDLALKSALETDLRQSRWVNVLDSGQIQNTLRMMRLAPDARLDQDTGRTVCRRAGARALLVPHILRAGDAYQLQVALVEPATARVADEVRVTARGREEVLLSAIDKLTSQLRGRLGESIASIARNDPPFAQYTTSSIEALQFLELGRRAWGDNDIPKAERSFREALQKDPHFAAARGSLGLILIQFLNRADEGRKMLAQALEEEGKVPEREYLHLRALNKQFVAEDLQGALDDYRFISELYPDLLAPYNNSGRILQQLGRFREAAAMYERASRADPRYPVPLWNLWFLAVRQLKDPATADRTARTLAVLQPDTANTAHATAWSMIALRRFNEAEAGMRATLKLDPAHPYALPNLGHLLYRRKEMAEAITVYKEVVKLAREGRLRTSLEHTNLCLGLAQGASGLQADARRTLLDEVRAMKARAGAAPLSSGDEAMVATLLAAAGRRDEARALADRASRGADGDGDASYELARFWAVMGDRTQAMRYLEQAFSAGYADTYMVLVDPPLAALQDDPGIARLAPPGAGPSS